MAIQLHTYLAPGDDPGDEILDRAVVVITHLGINRRGSEWVAQPRGSIYKTRAKFRAAGQPYETDVGLIARFNAANPESPQKCVVSFLNTAAPALDQVEDFILNLILQDPAQAGSIVVND